MSFRKRAAEIHARGVEERGNFTPSGTPLKMYKYWAGRTKHAPERENFCHFWRVVVLWAPLMFLRETTNKVLDSPLFQILIGLVAAAGVVAAIMLSPDFRVFLLTVLVAAAAVVVLTLLLVGITKAWRSQTPERKEAILGALVNVSLGVLGLIGVTALVLITIYKPIVLLLIAVAIVFSVVFIAALDKFATHLAGRRAIAREKEEVRREEAGPVALTEPAEPGMMSRLLSSLADFLIFAFQVARVKKWKICPMVQIDK